jgi:hypothetical protein
MSDLPKYDPTATSKSDEETNDPLIADALNFYKVEKWTKDGTRVDRMVYLLPARRGRFSAAAIYHRPRIRLTIRQRSLVLEEWPKAAT